VGARAFGQAFDADARAPYVRALVEARGLRDAAA
jgi:hypothetical protein